MGVLHKALLDWNKRLETEELLYPPPLSPQALGAPLLILLPAAAQNFSVFSVYVLGESQGGDCRGG